MQNVLFVNLPTVPFPELEASFRNEHFIPQRLAMPMGILYLSAYLRQSSRVGTVGMLDYILALKDASRYADLDDFLERVREETVGFRPDVIAFSLVFSTSHKVFTRALELLKKIWPEAVTVVGGTHATAAARAILDTTPIDFVVCGEGELALAALVEALDAGGSPEIPGVYGRANLPASGALAPAAPPEELDALPLPDYELIDMELYSVQPGSQRSLYDSREKRVATIVTTRGCPGLCTFCSAHVVHGRKLRYRSVENVLAEVKLLHERYGVTLFIPEDDMFTVPKKRFLALMRGLKELGIPGFEMQNQDGLSVNTLDPAIMDAMLAAGVKLFNLAVESGSEHVQRKVINKKVRLERVKGIIEYLQARGAFVRCYYILGFLGETKEQMRETIEFAKRVEADWSVFSIAVPLVGSEMHRQMLEAGYIANTVEDWTNASYGRRGFDTPEIKAAELEELAYMANIETNFLENSDLRRGDYEKAAEIFGDVVRVYTFHILAWYCLRQCYRGLGDAHRADEVTQKIASLLASDSRSQKMQAQYGHLVPDLLPG